MSIIGFQGLAFRVNRHRYFGAVGFSFEGLGPWRVGGLSKWVVSRLIGTLKRLLSGVMILKTYKSVK